MKTVQFICLLALVTAPALGSNTKVDSLKQLLEQHATTDKAEVLWGIAYELFDVDNTQALFYAERAYHEVWKRGDSLQIVKVGTTYGQLLRRMGKLDFSIEVSSRMLPIAKRHEYRKYWKMLLNSLASAYSYQEDYPIALESIYELLEGAEESDDLEGKVVALHNIGFLMYKLEDFDRAISYSLESIRLGQAIEEDVAITYLTIAAAHIEKENYDSARHYTSIAFGALREEKGSQVVAPYYQHFALSFFGLKNYDSAEYYSKLAISSAVREGHPWSQVRCYGLLSRMALLKRDNSSSRQYLEMALAVLKEVDFPWLRLEILRQMARFQAAVGNPDSTISLIDRHDALQRLIYNGKKAAAIRNVQVKHDERENRKQIALQSSILKIQEKYLSQQRVLILIVTVFLAIVILLSLALYRALNKMKLINQQLDLRVMDRTKELLRHRDALQHLIDEENGRRGRASAELIGLANTLKGLLHLAKVDSGKPDDEYLEKAMGLTRQVEAVSQKFSEQIQRKPQIPAA